MKCNCHLCKKKNTDAYWIMDMKFCKRCYDAITKGEIQKLMK